MNIKILWENIVDFIRFDQEKNQNPVRLWSSCYIQRYNYMHVWFFMYFNKNSDCLRLILTIVQCQ